MTHCGPTCGVKKRGGERERGDKRDEERDG